jgi:transcriptional regulator with XRE-family HTH domain
MSSPNFLERHVVAYGIHYNDCPENFNMENITISHEDINCVKIMLSMEIKFNDWLKTELDKRGLNQSQLAKLAGISRGTISNIMNENRGIGKNSLLSIARGLKLPATTVLRAASILPEEPEYIPLLDEWNAVFYELTPEDQQEILDIARMKAISTKRHKINEPEGSPGSNCIKE